MRRDACDMDLPTLQVDEKQHVVCHEPTQRPDLGREKLCRDQHVQMRVDELFPRRGGLALWRWRNAMAFQDVAHRLITDGQAQVGQGADNPVITPNTFANLDFRLFLPKMRF